MITNTHKAHFSKAQKLLGSGKPKQKSPTLRLQSCFIHIFLIWKEAPFIQEVLGILTSLVLDTDELKMVLRARKVCGAFKKWGPEHLYVLQNDTNFVNIKQVHTKKPQGSGERPQTDQHSMQKLQYILGISYYMYCAVQVRNSIVMSTNVDRHSFTVTCT